MKHRGISEVIGSVVMLGIVGGIAALILTFGLSSITNFQTFLIEVDLTEEDLKERFIVEFVRFEITTNDVDIYVRNVGLNKITINSISIVDIDDQNAILFDNNRADVVQPKSRTKILDLDTTCPVFVAADACISSSYEVTLVTARGNILTFQVIPLRA